MPRGRAWRSILGTTGHHGGGGQDTQLECEVGAPGAVSKVHGTGWAGTGDEDVTVPGKAWGSRDWVCRGLLEVRIEISCKHT